MADGDLQQNVIVQVSGAADAVSQIRNIDSAFRGLQTSLNAPLGNLAGGTSYFASLADIGKTTAAASSGMQTMGRSAGEMGDRTAAAFQHAGIYLFSRQLLDMFNMGALAQHAFLAISIGFEAVTDSIGVAASTIAPWLLALAGGMLIFEQWEKHLTKSAKAHEELAKKEQQALTQTVALKDAIDQYAKKLGTLPGYLSDLKDKTEALAKIEAQHAILEDAQAMAAIDRMRITREEREADLSETLRVAQAQLPVIQKNSLAYYDEKVAIAKVSAELKSLRDEETQDEQTKSKLAATIKELAAGHSGLIEGLKKEGDLNKPPKPPKPPKPEKDLIYGPSYVDYVHDIMLRHVEQDKDIAYFKKALDEKHAAEAKHLEEETALFSQTMGHVQSLTSSAFAKMIVEGTTFKEAFKNIAKQVEEAFVSAVIRMMEQWLMFEALTGVAGMFGLGGVLGASGWANIVGGTHFASGGDFMVNRPTMFIAGEGGGPERVQVTPQGPNAAAGGGGGSTVVNATINVSGSGDPRAVAQEIMRQVRGLAQLDFVRAH